MIEILTFEVPEKDINVNKREISAKNKCGKCVPMGGSLILLFLGNKLLFLRYEWVNV